jgi:indolepyruvate ferredoxin oxidoreductase alpha subunit
VEAGSDRSIGILTDGTSYQYVRRSAATRFSVLKLGMVWPLPEQRIRDFAATVDQLVVVEELDGVLEKHCRALGIPGARKGALPPARRAEPETSSRRS